MQQETGYIRKGSLEDVEPKPIPSYQAKPKAKTVMLHFAVNKLAGQQWGEPDIAPLLPWLARYASWIEDRVRLNRFRQAFMYVVTGKFASKADRIARQNELANNPPNPGSILVSDESEVWCTLGPQAGQLRGQQ